GANGHAELVVAVADGEVVVFVVGGDGPMPDFAKADVGAAAEVSHADTDNNFFCIRAHIFRVVVVPVGDVNADAARFECIASEQVIFTAQEFGAGPYAGVETTLVRVVQTTTDGSTARNVQATPQVHVGDCQVAGDFCGCGHRYGSGSECCSQSGHFQCGFLAHWYNPRS